MFIVFRRICVLLQERANRCGSVEAAGREAPPAERDTMRNNLLRMAVLAVVLLSVLPAATAQRNAYRGTIGFSEPEAAVSDGMLTVEMKADFGDLYLKRRQAVMLTPLLRLERAEDSYACVFPSVVVAGRARYRSLTAGDAGGMLPDEGQATVIRRRNRTEQHTDIRLSVPFEGWMRDAELVFVERTSGCTECGAAAAEYVMKLEGTLPPAFVPDYRPTFVEPAVATDTPRTVIRSATLTFPAGHSELLRDREDNARMLDETDRFIAEIRADTNLVLTGLRVDGHASPEGDAVRNALLAERRAAAFAEYLSAAYGIPSETIVRSGHGEDWEGLRRAVAASQAGFREQVLDIIDGDTDAAVRKRKLQALDGGRVYRLLRDSLYPSLRRIDFTLTCTVRPVTASEVRAIVKTRPELLRPAELYLAAAAVPVAGDEYRDILRTAHARFPDDSTVVTNLAAAEIVAGNPAAAVALLADIRTPAACNNLGIAYAVQGEADKAEAFFRRAAEAGSEEALRNLEQFLLWKADR